MYNKGMIEVQRCDSKERWDDYVLEHDGHPLQLWGWGQVKASHGWKVERVFVYDDEAVIGAAQVLVRSLPGPFRTFSYIPRGPMVENIHAEQVLSELALFVKRTYHSVALSIEPDTTSFSPPKDWVHSTNKILSAETILLDLNQSEADLLANMAKKTRQYIRKSASDVTIRQIHTTDEIEQCLKIYHMTARRAGFNVHADQYYRDVAIQLQDHSPIFGAFDDEGMVAFLWLAVSGYTAYELYGGMTERGQELRANYALKWHAIRKVKSWGLVRYDFGGLVAGGVTTFKQGWSAQETVFSGTFDKPLSPLYVLWSKGLPFAKRAVQAARRKK